MDIFKKKAPSAAADKPTAAGKPKKAVKAPKAVKDEVAKKEAKSSVIKNVPPALNAPHMSEKAARLSSAGTYVFDVPLSAGKVEVRKAVEAVYGVTVVRVNVVRGKGKVVRRGGRSGVRSDWKKALVTLKPGQKIDLYEGA